MRKLLYIAAGFISFTSFANTLTQTEKNFEFNFNEGNTFDISVNAELGYVDNFLFTSKNEDDTGYAKLSPRSFLQVHDDRHLLQFSASAESYSFDKFDEDNHSIFDFKGKYFYKLAKLHTLFGSAFLSDHFEYRGTGVSKGQATLFDSGNEYDDSLVNIGYRFGSFDSISKASLLVGTTEREYQTNKAITKVLDTRSEFAHLSFDYLISTKTYISMAVEYEDIEYKFANEQSRSQAAFLAGIKWESSALSYLTLLLGYETLDFEENALADSDIFKWRASYDWQPIDRINIKFSSGRATDKSNTIESNYVVKDNYSLAGSYKLSTLTRLTVDLNYIDETINFVETTVSEKYISLRSHIDYKMNDWMMLYIKGMVENKSSDLSLNKYDKNSFSLGVVGTF